MILPFDKIKLTNFHHYVKAFFPNLYDHVYGDDFDAYSVHSHDFNNMSDTKKQILEIVYPELLYNQERDKLRQKAIIIEKMTDSGKFVIYKDIETTNDLFHNAFIDLLKNRHLEEYWIQSTLLEKL